MSRGVSGAGTPRLPPPAWSLGDGSRVISGVKVSKLLLLPRWFLQIYVRQLERIYAGGQLERIFTPLISDARISQIYVRQQI